MSIASTAAADLNRKEEPGQGTGLFVDPVLVSLLMTIIQIYREEYHNHETGTPTSPATPS